MFGPDWEVDGLHVTSMYHWLVPGPERRLDLVRPAGDAVTISVMLLKCAKAANYIIVKPLQLKN